MPRLVEYRRFHRGRNHPRYALPRFVTQGKVIVVNPKALFAPYRQCIAPLPEIGGWQRHVQRLVADKLHPCSSRRPPQLRRRSRRELIVSRVTVDLHRVPWSSWPSVDKNRVQMQNKFSPRRRSQFKTHLKGHWHRVPRQIPLRTRVHHRPVLLPRTPSHLVVEGPRLVGIPVLSRKVFADTVHYSSPRLTLPAKFGERLVLFPNMEDLLPLSPSFS